MKRTVLVALLAALACGGEPSTERGGDSAVGGARAEPDTVGSVEDDLGTTGSDATPATPSETRDAWLASTSLPSGWTSADVVRAFGPPDRRSASAQPNRHVPGQTDSIVTLVYDRGLRVELYAITGGRELMQEAVVSSTGILASPIDVGTSWEAVVEAFGEPQGKRDGMPYFVCGSCTGAEEPVYFAVEDGVVQRIRFRYYVD